jgi:hypothetical protein
MAGTKKVQVVTAPLVAVHDDGGRLFYLYAGARLDGVTEDDVKRLDDLGMLGEESDVTSPMAAVAHPTADSK